MALVLADRVRDTTTTTGTGTITLSGTAPTGYQNFSVVGNGNTTYYTINADSQWEVGIGTYSSTGPTLSRNTVLASSNGGALVDFAAGTKDVFITYPAEKAVTDAYGTALAATTATNIAGGAAGSIPYQTAANTTSLLAAGTGVLIGGSTPSYTMSPSLTQVTVAADPSTALQVATKQYVDTIAASGVTYHTPVKYEVPSPLTATYNNGSSGVGATLTNAGTLAAFAPDGPTASVGDRILVYTQTNAAQNGIYTVTTVGSGSVAWVLTRATDADTYALKSPTGLGEGDAFFVMSGNTGAGETYVMNTVGTITFGTTAINFVQVSDAAVYSAGTGLTLTGTMFSLTSPVATTLGGTGLTSFTSGGAVYATSSSALTTGTLPATAGGTGQSSYTTGDLLYATSGTALGALADVATGNALLSGGVGAAPSWGKVGLTTHVTGTLPVANGGSGATSLTGYLVGNGTSAFTATTTIPTSDLSGTISLTTQISGTLGAGNGGTGISSYTVGDIVYASATTTLSTLADVATGNALISGGVSNPPSWGKIGLTTHVSGTLPVSNGGTGATTLTGYVKGNGTSAFTASATIPAGDITGAALTKADDTNVTLTLGGSPTTALLAATSITAGWTGQLAVSRGGTGNSTLASGYLLKGNGTSAVSASVIYDDGTNVGIGTTSAPYKLTVSNGGADGFEVGPGYSSGYVLLQAFNRSTSTYSIMDYAGSIFRWLVSGSEKMRLDSSGRFVVGTTAALNNNMISAYGSSQNAFVGQVTNNIYSLFQGLNSSGVMAFQATGDGVTISTASFRAPIFYDYDNTAYYLDAAGNSVFSNVQNGVNYTSGGGGGRLVVGPGSPYSLRQEFGSDNTGWRYGIAKNVSGTVTDLFYVQDTGPVVATGDMRAPIFYDSNNTAYYLDAAGNSVFSAFNIGGGEVYFYGSATNAVSIRTGAGGAYKYFTFDASGNFYALNGSVYGDTFYDQTNTAYYANPAGTSNLYTVVTNAQTPAIAFKGDIDGAKWMQKLGGYNLSFMNDGGAGFDSVSFDGRTYYNKFYLDNAGNAYAYSSFRAQIFYDSNNTSYYVDPASGSVLGGNISILGQRNITLSTSTGSVQIKGDTGGWSIGTLFYGSSGTYRGGFGALGGGDALTYYWIGSDYNTAALYVYASGYAEASGSLRAPIFYDSNDTSYYVDAASNTILNTLYLRNSGIPVQAKFAQASQFGYSSSYRTVVLGNEYLTTISMGVDVSGNASGSFNGGGEGREILFRNGVNFITPNSANNSYLNPLNLLDGYAYNYTSMRSSIFYDSDDTARYWNGAGGFNQIFGSGNRVTYYSDDSGIHVSNAEGCGQDVRVGAAWGRAGLYAPSYVSIGTSGTYIEFVFSNNQLGVMTSSGNLTMTGNITAYSDARLKKDVETIDGALALVSKMRGVTYTRKDTGSKGIGVIAQEMREVVPQVIEESAEGTLSVAYGNLVGVLIEAVKELTARVTELEGK